MLLFQSPSGDEQALLLLVLEQDRLGQTHQEAKRGQIPYCLPMIYLLQGPPFIVLTLFRIGMPNVLSFDFRLSSDL
jgi:hypothetical protein